MKSEHNKEQSQTLNLKEELVSEFIDLNRFRKLDDKYMVTDLCKKSKLGYKVKEDFINIYHRSFGGSISFNENKVKSIFLFVDFSVFLNDNKEKFKAFLKGMIREKSLNISVNNLENMINKVNLNIVKELKISENNESIYISKIYNINKELVFLLITLNEGVL